MPRPLDSAPASPKESSLRTAIRAVLASGLIFISSGDSTNPVHPPKRENYEHLFEGIEILPPGSPKGRPTEEEPQNEINSDENFHCDPDICKYG